MPTLRELAADASLPELTIDTVDHLFDVAKKYPQLLKTAIIPILEHPEKHPVFIKSFSDYIHLLPLYSHIDFFENFCKRLLSNTETFDRFIVTADDLILFFNETKLISIPANFQDGFNELKKRKNDPAIPQEVYDAFQHFYENRAHLMNAGRPIPNYASALITRLTSNFQTFQRLLARLYNFQGFFDLLHPHYTEQFLTAVLSDQRYFNHILQYKRNETLHFTDYISGLTLLINSIKCLNLPAYVDLLIARLRGLTYAEFSAAIPTAEILITIISSFQKQADFKPLISAILADPEAFKRFVVSNEQLKKLAALYPNIEILQSKTIWQVVDKIKQYRTVKNNAGFVRLGARENDCQFSRLNAFLLFKIVEDTADKEKTDSKTLTAVINKALFSPSM